MATTTQDDGFHEIQLNGKQLVFLFMAVTVVSVVIFLFGVLVGRGLPGSTVAASEPAAADVSAEQLAEAPPPPAVGGSTDAPSTAGETLTYTDRLNGAATNQEQLKSAKEAAAPVPTPAPVAAPPVAAPAKPAATAAAAPSEPGGPGFAIQVAALRERVEADAVANRLIGKGYQAYVVAPASGGPSVFRVRVGKFREKREADTVAARLQKEEQFKPWVLR